MELKFEFRDSSFSSSEKRPQCCEFEFAALLRTYLHNFMGMNEAYAPLKNFLPCNLVIRLLSIQHYPNCHVSIYNARNVFKSFCSKCPCHRWRNRGGAEGPWPPSFFSGGP